MDTKEPQLKPTPDQKPVIPTLDDWAYLKTLPELQQGSVERYAAEHNLSFRDAFHQMAQEDRYQNISDRGR